MSDFRTFGTEQDGYIDNVTFTLTDVVTDLPVYYVTVKAVNGAGMVSVTGSSR